MVLLGILLFISITLNSSSSQHFIHHVEGTQIQPTHLPIIQQHSVDICTNKEYKLGNKDERRIFFIKETAKKALESIRHKVR